MENYFYDCYSILNRVYSDKQFIKQAINESFIDESHRSLTVKICYGVIDRDVELSYYIKNLADKTPKLAVRTILKISMYMMKYLGKKEYFVVQNAVELTKKLGKGGASGFVNAFLRKFIAETLNGTSELPLSDTALLSVKYSYPEFAVKMLCDDYGKERTEKIISAPYPDNTLCFYRSDGKKYLTERETEFSETPFENVFTVKNFARNADYDKGIYTYQALGSVAICETVTPCGTLLDCCAAPGGKSVRLSYKIGKIIAWDIHPHRVKLIEEYAKRMGRENVTAFVKDAKVYDAELKKAFDAVLCDAPCSGFGVAGDNPDIKLNKSPETVSELVKEQAAILNTVCEYVKTGGYLYYSTCSVFLRENIGIIRDFISRRTDFEIEKTDSPLPHEDYDGTNAFLPDISFGNGFYVAKLKRIR